MGGRMRLNNIEGRVIGVSIRRTTIQSDDGAIHTIPNGSISLTTNISRGTAPVAPVGAYSPAHGPASKLPRSAAPARPFERPTGGEPAPPIRRAAIPP